MQARQGADTTYLPLSPTTLDYISPIQLVWFLAPTVALCEQQYDVFQANLPGYGHLLLCGRDVELWTTQSAWNEVFRHNVRIVMSTHQILLDALTHGFMSLQKLALLIFDEGPLPAFEEESVSLMHPSSPLYIETSGSQDNV